MMGHCQMKYIGDTVTDMLEKEGIPVDNQLLQSMLIDSKAGCVVPYNAKEKSQLDNTALKIYRAMKTVTKK